MGSHSHARSLPVNATPNTHPHVHLAHTLLSAVAAARLNTFTHQTKHRALQNAYRTLASVGTSKDMLDQLATFKEFNELVGMEASLATEERLSRRDEKLTVRVRAPTKIV